MKRILTILCCLVIAAILTGCADRERIETHEETTTQTIETQIIVE